MIEMKRMNSSVEYHKSKINNMYSAALRTPSLGEGIALIFRIKDAIDEIDNPNIKETIEKHVEREFSRIHDQLYGIL